MTNPGTMPLENPVQLAVIGAAHGIKGEVRVKALTEDPMALAAYGPLYTSTGRSLTIADLRPGKGVLIVRFEGVADRNAAEALNGEALFIDRSALPAELEDEEFYHADLIGLAVVDEAGEGAGRIVAVHDFGAGDLLEIRPPSGQTVLIPFTRDAVPNIDLNGGRVHINRRAAGLEDETPPSGKRTPGSEGPDATGGRS